MSTGTVIIQEAFRRIGVHSIASPAPTESINLALNTLNTMLQLWISWGIDVQTIPLSVVGDELAEPIDATNAIIDNLAVMVSPNFDNGETIVSDQLRSNANLGFMMIKTLYTKFTIPNKVPSATLPLGAGNSRGILRFVFFRGRALSD